MFTHGKSPKINRYEQKGMNYLKKLLHIFLVGLLWCALPLHNQANAQTSDYQQWTGSQKEYHLYDDVRTITFSHPVSETSLQIVGGTKPITLWDVTNPEKKQQLTINLAVMDDNPNKVTVSLANGEEYIDGHHYSLLIEKDVKPSSSNARLKQPIQYDFTMVYLHPEVVTFAENYKITNTSRGLKSIKIPHNAYTVITNEYGDIEGGDSQASSVLLYAGSSAFVSYLDKPINPIVGTDDIAVEKTDYAAYTGLKLYERNSVEMTNHHEYKGDVISYIGDRENSTVHSRAKYPKLNTTDPNAQSIPTYKKPVTKDMDTIRLGIGEQTVVTNEDHERLYVFSPNTSFNFTTLKETSDEAVTSVTATPGDKFQFNSTETTDSSFVYLHDQTKKGAYSFVSYNDQESYNRGLNKAVYDYGDDVFRFRTQGDLLVENTGVTNVTLYAPSRFVTINKTTEELFTTHTIKPEEKVKFTSTDNINPSYVGVRDLSKRGVFSYAAYAKDELKFEDYNRKVDNHSDDRIPVPQNGETILKNAGKTDLLLYGEKRFTAIESVTEEPFSEVTINPGESLNVTTSQEKIFTRLNLKDPSRKGTFSYQQIDKKGSSENTSSFTFGSADISIDKNYVTLVKNTGPTPIVAYGAGRFITYH